MKLKVISKPESIVIADIIEAIKSMDDVYLDISNSLKEIFIKLSNIPKYFKIAIIISDKHYEKLLEIDKINLVYSNNDLSYKMLHCENIQIICTNLDKVKDDEMYVYMQEDYEPIRVIFQ